jgi:hypothetical protein
MCSSNAYSYELSTADFKLELIAVSDADAVADDVAD